MLGGVRHKGGILLIVASLLIPCVVMAGQVQYFYDPTGRLQRVITDTNTGSIYEYDRTGNILSIDTLNITQDPPVVYSITPAWLFKGALHREMVITGRGFFMLEDVFTDNPGVILRLLRFNDKRIVVLADVTSQATPGISHIIVKTSYGQASGTYRVLGLNFEPESLKMVPGQKTTVSINIEPSPAETITLEVTNPDSQVIIAPSTVVVPQGGEGLLQVEALTEGTVVLRIEGVGLPVWVTGPLEGDVSLQALPVSVSMPLLVKNNTDIHSPAVSIGRTGYPGFVAGGPVSVQIMDFLKTPGTYFDRVSVQMPFEAIKVSSGVGVRVSQRFIIDTPFKAEGGIIQVDSNWQRIETGNTYINPVVVARPLSKYGADPAVVRIRNVGPDGFEIRIQEWQYLDGTHITEKVSFLVIEAGHYILDSGVHVEAGTISTDRANPQDSFEVVTFRSTFPSPPVVVTSVMTENGAAPVVTRNRNVTTSGFEVSMQEEEAGDAIHAVETIGYVAWQAGTGVIDSVSFEAGGSVDVTDAWTFIPYGPFHRRPIILMDMQTTNGTDTANLRYQNRQADGIEVQVCEEQSADSEVSHVAESVGYLIFY